ncbi:hypothetical protein B0H10DRAFT_2304006 [Mycena sp. CBHHK59/15]|nr:hypothetical protein B0H10DRAFT_2304006 [Mycena sp. CBHHK59/15]
MQPFTHGFPRADIHELLSSDLLHQVIKDTFKDHIVSWINEYLHLAHGEKRALEIIEDIDWRISAVPEFPGLRCFPDGRDCSQWTGDDSKALMKVAICSCLYDTTLTFDLLEKIYLAKAPTVSVYKHLYTVITVSVSV